MSKKINRTDAYDATPAQLLAMLSDPAYLEAKYSTLGDIKSDVLSQDTTGGGLELKVDRTVPSDMPSVAKKVLGETNNLIQSESWTADGDGYKCSATIESPGKPIHITGSYQIAPAGAGSTWAVSMEIKASVPMIGGKIEEAIEKETNASLDKEYEFNKQWLASH